MTLRRTLALAVLAGLVAAAPDTAEAESPYADFSELTEGAEVLEGFFDLYRKDGKLHMAVAADRLGEDFLMEYKIASVREDSAWVVEVSGRFVSDLAHVSEMVRQAVATEPGRPGAARFAAERVGDRWAIAFAYTPDDEVARTLARQGAAKEHLQCLGPLRRPLLRADERLPGHAQPVRDGARPGGQVRRRRLPEPGPRRRPERAAPLRADSAGRAARGAGPARGPGLRGRLDYPWYGQVAGLQATLLSELTSPYRLSRIRDAEARYGAENVVGIPELMGRITRATWLELEEGGNVPATRRELQRSWIERMTTLVVDAPEDTPADARAVARGALTGVGDRIEERLAAGGEMDDYTRHHLEESRARIREALEAGLQIQR